MLLHHRNVPVSTVPGTAVRVRRRAAGHRARDVEPGHPHGVHRRLL